MWAMAAITRHTFLTHSDTASIDYFAVMFFKAQNYLTASSLYVVMNISDSMRLSNLDAFIDFSMWLRFLTDLKVITP